MCQNWRYQQMPRVTNKTQVQLGVLIQSSLRFCLRLGSLIVDDHPLGARVRHGLHGSGGSTDGRLGGHGGRFWGQLADDSRWNALRAWAVEDTSCRHTSCRHPWKDMKPMKTYENHGSSITMAMTWVWDTSDFACTRSKRLNWWCNWFCSGTPISDSQICHSSPDSWLPLRWAVHHLWRPPCTEKKKAGPATDWTVLNWLWTRIYH